MKTINKLLLFAVGITAFLQACEKKEVLPLYKPGTVSTLSSSAATVTPSPADSSKTVLTLNWTSPGYANVDSFFKYIIQIDTANGNFSNPYAKLVTGVKSPDLMTSFTGKDLNNILIGFGASFGKATGIKARLLSSYPNNNEQLISEPVSISVTPYSYAFDLNTTANGPFNISLANRNDTLQKFMWSRPNVGNGTFTYKLQYDKAGNNFAGAKDMDVNKDTSYAAIGSIMNKFAHEAGIAYDQAGEVEFRVLATLNGIQSLVSAVKKFTITPTELISYLYLPGDYQGWNPGAAPKMASTNVETYEGYVNMTSAGGFKMNSSPDWNHTNYGDGGPGKLSTSGGNLSLPVGYYLLKSNLVNLTWSSTLITTWGVIGDATPGSWDNSTPLIYDAAANVWKATINFSGSGAFKFRANNGWDINLGGSPTYLEYNGGNISSPSAGPHEVTLDLRNPLKYTYTVQ